MKKALCAIFIGIIFLNFIIAIETDLDPVERGECQELYQRCDNCSYVNLTKILYPNGTIEIINNTMTQNDIDYNYTFCNTNDIGIYQYTVKGDNNGEVDTATFSFEVTNSGMKFDEGQAIGGLAIFIGLLAVAFSFLFVGSKLTQNDKTLPIGFFFIVFAIIIVIFSLHMGWVFSVELLQHETISGGVSTIFRIVIWTSSGLTIIFFALMLIAFIKELGNVAKKKKFGDDFNPLTNTYD